MMYTLEELIGICKPYGMNDYEIIKRFFIVNKIEDQAIEMLTELSRDKMKDLHYTNSYQKEYIEYCSAVLSNQVPEEVKIDLFTLAKKFLLYENLTKAELKRCQQIFDNNKITICPIWFYNYLKREGVIKGELIDQDIFELENFIKRRDAHL